MNGAGGATRTGPIGRVARMALLTAMAASLVSIVDQGGAVALRDSSMTSEPALVLLTAVMAVLFVRLVGELARVLGNERTADWARLIAAGGLAAALAVAAATGQFAYGELWGVPVVDVIWWFDVAMLGQTILALAVAIRLGTPGCEIGVWIELLYRARGERMLASPVLCVVGLDFVDEWEARRSRAAGREVT